MRQIASATTLLQPSLPSPRLGEGQGEGLRQIAPSTALLQPSLPSPRLGEGQGEGLRQIAPSTSLLQPLVRAGLGIGILVGLLLAVGPPDVWSHLERLNLRWLALAAPLYAASLLVRGLRWHILLRPLHPRRGWLDTTAISTLGWSLNNVLPFR